MAERKRPRKDGSAAPGKARRVADAAVDAGGDAPERRGRFMSWVLMSLAVIAVLIGLVWMFGPRESGRFNPPEIAELPEDLDNYLFQEESGVRPDVARRIVWAGRTGVKTPVSIVYLHGFSATLQELRPVPDLIAAWRGSNLYFARLNGHGMDKASMGAARVDDWARDVAEAIAIGKRIGEKVVVIGSSTGGTLAAMAARDPELGPQIAGVVLVSPNFRPLNRWTFLARQPLARQWLPILAGGERCFEPLNERHRMFWTSCYPVVATLPMAALAAEAEGTNFSAATQPLLALWSDDDQVVDPAVTKRVLESWGGEVTIKQVTVGPGDDPSAHVIAGDILSPGQTAPVATGINGWITRNFGD
ncbi:carboxylesterase [Paracoccus sp. SCSIO 75233]|uniref:alpha/beta hydrolase n=1 Tax=Paracoccus sp. SCSIO 75233 TaxID=3017782 RepID=UPI0022F0C45E|nr:alpha/beta fold hydrolase [Paracoccus sp. SCSIO 75233]WBU51975.1 alpha/beta fold hydrolase [Paracoccus sp. SCSIO 75233]